jgi:hypothetical protein
MTKESGERKMSEAEGDILARVGSLNLWKRHGERSRHKPLLILLGLAGSSEASRDSRRSPRSSPVSTSCCRSSVPG